MQRFQWAQCQFSFCFVVVVDLLFNADQQHKHYFTVMFEKSVCVGKGGGGGGANQTTKAEDYY